MADIKATFVADFRQFNDALRDASGQIKTFEYSTRNLQGSLQTMVRQFDGSRIQAEAAKMVVALEKVGGASRLTDTEQRRVNATVTEAIAKYKALGQQVPADLQRIAKETGTVATETTSAFTKMGNVLKSTFGQMAGALAIDRVIGDLVGSIKRAATEAVAFGSKIHDLSIKTGLSQQALQEYGYAAEQTGGSLESLTTATFKLQQKIGEGSKETRKALSELGLSYNALRKLAPEEQFKAVASALGDVRDQAKFAELGVALFGRGFGEIATTVREGFGDMVAEARRLGLVMSDELVKKLDDLGDAEKRLQIQLRARAAEHAEAIYTVKNAYDALKVGIVEALGKAIEWWQKAKAFLPGSLGVMARMNQPSEEWAAGFTAEQIRPQGAHGEVPGNLPLILDPEAAARAAKKAGQAAWEAFQQSLRMNPPIPAQWALPEPGGLQVGKPSSWFQTGLGILPSTGFMPGLMTPSNVRPQNRLLSGGAGFLAGGFGNLTSFAGGLSGSILSALQGGGNVGQSVGGFAGAGLAQSVVGSFSKSFAGSALGKVLGGVLPGLGSLLGPLVGWLGDKLFGGEAKRTKQARSDFLEQAGGLEALRQQAELAGFSLDKLLTTKKTKTFEAEVQKLNAALAEMAKRVAAITTELDTLNTSGGLLSQGLLAKITADMQNPEVQSAVFAFMQAQAQTALQALEAYVTRATVRTTAGAQALAASTVALFGELQAQGLSAVEALEALSPSIDALGTKFDQLGLGGGEAFDTIRRLAGIAASEVTGPMVQSISDLTRLMTALGNLGLLTQETFSGLAGEITATYQELMALGTDPHDTLVLLQGPLQRLYELQQRFGFEVDESTRALLEQAQQAGLVGDQFKDAQERMVDALNRLIGRFDVLLQSMGLLPEAAADAARGVQDQFDRVRLPRWEAPEDWGGGGEVPAYASGSGGLVNFGAGTPAILHGREAVLTEAQYRALTGGSGRGVVVNVDARGALLNDPASQASLARVISDAVMAQQSLRGWVN